jgi:hypothetical protein
MMIPDHLYFRNTAEAVVNRFVEETGHGFPPSVGEHLVELFAQVLAEHEANPLVETPAAVTAPVAAPAQPVAAGPSSSRQPTGQPGRSRK